MNRLAAKQAIRERVWQAMEAPGIARFPFPPQGRIPNFTGAEKCASHLATIPEWRDARRIKCNPDAPQRAVRLLALKEGKQVFMAVPRLTDVRCFVRLDPRRLVGNLSKAASIKGAFQHGEQVTPAEMGAIDLVVAGSVAVNRRGARVGKGGGYSDLEFGLARELDLVAEETPVLTTVHGVQVVDADIPMTAHDVPLDYVVTPEGVIRTERAYGKPPGILWDHLTDEQVAAMPPVARARDA